MQLLAAQIEEAVLEADILGIFLLASDRHRQLGGGRLDGHFTGDDLDLAGRKVRVHRLRTARHDIAGDGDDQFGAQSVQLLEHRASGGRNDLGDAVMIAQIDEQDAAVIALAVDPAGQADGRADVGSAELAAVMGAIGVHLPVR